MNETTVVIITCIFAFSLCANLVLYIRLTVWRASQRELVLKYSALSKSMKVLHQCLLEANAKGMLESEENAKLKKERNTLVHSLAQKECAALIGGSDKPKRKLKPRKSKKKGNIDETGTGKDK